jgi:hypothetical protein
MGKLKANLHFVCYEKNSAIRMPISFKIYKPRFGSSCVDAGRPTCPCTMPMRFGQPRNRPLSKLNDHSFNTGNTSK